MIVQRVAHGSIRIGFELKQCVKARSEPGNFCWQRIGEKRQILIKSL